MSNEAKIGSCLDGLTYVVVTAVQDGLVRSEGLADAGQDLDNPQTQLLALLSLVHRDILDVSDYSQTPQELLLHENGSSANHLVVRLGNDDDGEVHLVGFEFLAGAWVSGRRAE